MNVTSGGEKEMFSQRWGERGNLDTDRIGQTPYFSISTFKGGIGTSLPRKVFSDQTFNGTGTAKIRGTQMAQSLVSVRKCKVAERVPRHSARNATSNVAQNLILCKSWRIICILRTDNTGSSAYILTCNVFGKDVVGKTLHNLILRTVNRTKRD